MSEQPAVRTQVIDLFYAFYAFRSFVKYNNSGSVHAILLLSKLFCWKQIAFLLGQTRRAEKAMC